jgi:hypothetical protein
VLCLGADDSSRADARPERVADLRIAGCIQHKGHQGHEGKNYWASLVPFVSMMFARRWNQLDTNENGCNPEDRLRVNGDAESGGVIRHGPFRMRQRGNATEGRFEGRLCGDTRTFRNGTLTGGGRLRRGQPLARVVPQASGSSTPKRPAAIKMRFIPAMKFDCYFRSIQDRRSC